MKKIILIILMAFTLNFFWEISQAFLYASHYSGTSEFFSVHLRASLGDMLMLIALLLFDALILKKIFLQEKLSAGRMAGIIFIGSVLAVAVEKYALASGRWAYDPLMPVVPIINVGLMPVLQMMLIPAVVAIFWERMKK